MTAFNDYEFAKTKCRPAIKKHSVLWPHPKMSKSQAKMIYRSNIMRTK